MKIANERKAKEEAAKIEKLRAKVAAERKKPASSSSSTTKK